jgi:hypothetical protein
VTDRSQPGTGGNLEDRNARILQNKAEKKLFHKKSMWIEVRLGRPPGGQPRNCLEALVEESINFYIPTKEVRSE